MRVGIDFGTTNSSVAHFDGQDLTTIILDKRNENQYVLPSLIYIDRQLNSLLGMEAAEEYLKQENGRRPVWEKRFMGVIEVIVAGGNAPIRYLHDIYELIDTAANGRLLQSVKTALRDPEYEGTQIFDRYYTIDELIALILKNMKGKAERQLGETADNLVLGRPVQFSEDSSISERAEEILFKAARFAGFRQVSFQLEPIAAAHLYHQLCSKRELALVFDFGGGTLDLTVVELGGKTPPNIIATRGVLVGGDDLDRRIMESLLKYFGKGIEVEPEVLFPHDMLDALKNWQTMPELSRPFPLGRIRSFQKTAMNPNIMRALETLVTENVGFQLFKKIESTKKELSENLISNLQFRYKNINIAERILRRGFEELIKEELLSVKKGIDQVLKDSNLTPEQITVVLRTGGSSQIPAFVNLLASIFSMEKIKEMDPLTSVVGGMSIVAHEESGRQPGSYVQRYISPIHNIQSSSGREYRNQMLRAYEKAYTDRDYIITRLPLWLSGLPSIKPADLDYEVEQEEHLSFQLTKPSKVYIAYQSTPKSLPFWLKSFTPESGLIEIEHINNKMPFPIYSKKFPAGKVTLGGNRAKGCHGPAFMNYLVAVEPILS
jgi:hypothetical chaperone protein